MNEQLQIEAMARVDGLELPTGLTYDGTDLRGAIAKRGEDLVHVPDYLTDHNAVQRVIDGLSDRALITYQVRLCSIVGCVLGGRESYKSTCEHKVEAILLSLIPISEPTLR